MRSATRPVAAVRSYRRQWLPRDIVAGLVLSALLVPQGMAYAELAGLPPVTGLYTSVLCLLGYAVFGPSKVLVLGPDSSLGPMIAATLAPLLLANGDPARAVVLASMLAVLVGAVMVVAGVARLGFIADLLSKPTQMGYMNGLALTIIVGQLAKLLGFSVDADGLIAEARAVVDGIRAGEVNRTAAAIGIGSLVGILLMQRLIPKIPAVLVVVVAAALIVNVGDLAAHGVDTIGVLPQGLPSFDVPLVAWSDMPLLALGAIGIAIVALADTISTASSFAARRRETVRGNQEMIGIGAANIAAGLFQGFPVSTSGSRTAVASQAGARSQLAGVVGAAVIAFVLLFANELMEYVPQPTLAAIVIAAAFALADIPGTRRLWRQRRTEFFVSITALLGVAFLGVLAGIVLAVVLSILDVFRRVWWPYQAELGQVEGMAGMHDDERHPEAAHLPGLVVFRFDAPLVFANATTFRDEVRRLANAEPKPTWILIAAEPVTDVDTTASDVLEDLDEALNAEGISLVFAEVKDPVRDKIERYGLTRTINPRHFYPTLESAIAAFRQETSAEWTTAGQTTDHPGGPGRTGAETSPPPDVPASPPAS